MQSPGQAFEAWGSYDQDEPHPLSAEARKLGAVHQVTLVDGHDARRLGIGQWVFWVIAIGLFAYGGFCVADAKYPKAA